MAWSRVAQALRDAGRTRSSAPPIVHLPKA
jgi:hypothetical protein